MRYAHKQYSRSTERARRITIYVYHRVGDTKEMTIHEKPEGLWREAFTPNKALSVCEGHTEQSQPDHPYCNHRREREECV